MLLFFSVLSVLTGNRYITSESHDKKENRGRGIIEPVTLAPSQDSGVWLAPPGIMGVWLSLPGFRGLDYEDRVFNSLWTLLMSVYSSHGWVLLLRWLSFAVVVLEELASGGHKHGTRLDLDLLHT